MVLPQGDFAEFLRASGADRRAILLPAARRRALRRACGSRANSRAELAGQRVLLLDDQLGGLADATDEAVAAAEQREAALQAFRDGLAVTRAAAGSAVTGALEPRADTGRTGWPTNTGG